MLENYEEVTLAVGQMLTQYLEKHGIEAADGKLFSCLDPAHEDSNPSCRVIPDDPVVAHCFGCGSNFTIFKAAHFLEDKPLSGPGFITDNVAYLAEMFDIPISLRPLTEEEQYCQKVYQAYDQAAEYLSKQEFNEKGLAFLKERNWDPEKLKVLRVGQTKGFKSFNDYMQAQGWTAEFLNDIDLGLFKGRPHPMFNKDMILFTIQDQHGRPCGFSGRNLNWTNDSEDIKYWNSQGLLRGDIYRKGERLYNLHRCKPAGPLYIVEGYGDCITLFVNGVINVAAVGGTAFTADHVKLLLKLGYRDIILAFDGDKAGQNRTEKIISGYLSGHKDLRIKVVTIPDEMDPDEFVRAKGVDEWNKLEPLSAFAWRLSRFPIEADDAEICEVMIPLIVNEASPVYQEKMCRELAQRTGIRAETIFKELDRHMDMRKAELHDRKENLIRQGMQNALRDTESAAMVVREVVRQLEEIDKANDKNLVASSEFVDALDAQADHERGKSPVPEIFRLGPRLKAAENLFEGADVKDALCILGGVANCGKTNLLTQMAYEFAKYNNNITVIFHTIDDNRKQLVTKLLMHALEEESGDIKLNWLKHPNYYEKFDPGIKAKHALAYQRIQALANDSKLIVKDMMLGTNTVVIESMIRHFREKFPSRDLIFILDNFSLLQALANSDKQEDHYRLRETATEIKRMMQRYSCLGIMTQEYTKLEPKVRPTMNNLKGSSGIMYDANIIMHLYNDMNAKQDESELFHIDSHGFKLPTVEWIFEKTKVNDFKFASSSVFMDTIPYKAQATIIPKETVDRRRAQIRADRESEQGKLLWENGKARDISLVKRIKNE
jgi:DNA primase catalytic core